MNESRLESILLMQCELLEKLVEAVEQTIPASRRKTETTATGKAALTQDDYDALDKEIDFEWWFQQYGEKPLPARYMNQQGLPYSREESVYLFRRMCEIVRYPPPTVNNGSHVFKYVGKVYCKAEKNTVNCFMCVPINDSTVSRPIEE